MNDDPDAELIMFGLNGPAAGMLEVRQLKAELRKAQDKLVQFVSVNLDQADEIDRLKAENERLAELVKLHMAADLARADLDRD